MALGRCPVVYGAAARCELKVNHDGMHSYGRAERRVQWLTVAEVDAIRAAAAASSD